MTAALAFENVDILFTGLQGRKREAAIKAALASLDQGRSRAEIQAASGVVVGVAGASLSIEQGQIFVLMGLSGSGKSTLLRAANGLNPVTRGRVLVTDAEQPVDVAHCDAATLRRLRRGRIAMIFQQFGLLPWRTVRENVGPGPRAARRTGCRAPSHRRREARARWTVAMGRSLRPRALRRACSSASVSRARSRPTRRSC
jgi:glycine betaine/proline transport system ATP-binding protein